MTPTELLLTERQGELYRLLVSTDLKMRQIAFQMGITLAGVKSLETKILLRLGARSRLELIARERASQS